MGYAAMAVGERDLVLPLDELKKRAAAARLTLLAANLVDAHGKRPFSERLVATVGGRKIGLFAIVEGAEFERAGLRVLLPSDVARGQVEALRREGAELVVGLFHLKYDAALRLAGSLPGLDLALQAHDGRLASPQRVGEAILLAGGERGRQVGRAVLTLDGKGPLFDHSEADEARAGLVGLEREIASIEARVKAYPAEKAQLAPSLAAMQRRQAELKARAEAKAPAGRRTVLADFVALDARVPDDPATKKAVEAAPR